MHLADTPKPKRTPVHKWSLFSEIMKFLKRSERLESEPSRKRYKKWQHRMRHILILSHTQSNNFCGWFQFDCIGLSKSTKYQTKLINASLGTRTAFIVTKNYQHHTVIYLPLETQEIIYKRESRINRSHFKYLIFNTLWMYRIEAKISTYILSRLFNKVLVMRRPCCNNLSADYATRKKC